MPQPDSQLPRSSPLFWLTLLLAIGMAVMGARFFIAPQAAAADFGVPQSAGHGLAFACAAGARDLFAGLAFFPFLLTGQRRAVGWIALLAALIPILDGTIVIRFAGVEPRFLVMHWGSALLLLALAWLLLRRFRHAL